MRNVWQRRRRKHASSHTRACRAETTCYTPQPYPFGINYDWRACLGDDAKWLNDNCMFAYINIAGGSTKSVPTLVRVAPQYTDTLRTIHFHCMELDEVRALRCAPALQL